MSVLSAHGGHGDLAPELGLRGIPARSLVEFEGGGSMLSRDVLGEILAVNERGILNLRGEIRKRPAGRREEDQLARWGQGRGGGTTEEAKRTRLLCQADALAWLREPTQANIRRPTDRTTRGRGGSAEGSDAQQRSQRSMSRNGRRSHVGVDEGVIAQNMSSTGAGMFSSPNGRARPLVKLYDHDHNPRVLRSLVDDAVVTGIVGGGALKTEEGKEMDELRLQLRLACHRATELEDQIFRSQTGAPHRELLGELQLDRENNAVPHLNGGTQSASMAGRPEVTVDVSGKRCVLPYSRRRSQQRQQHWSSSSSKRQEPADEAYATTPRVITSPGTHFYTTPARPDRNAPHFTPSRSGGGGGERPNDSMYGTPGKEHTPRAAKHAPNKNVRSAIITTCKPPLSPPLTPTTSLRRYLSSLRPFSADSARAAWGLADTTGEIFAAPSDPRRHRNVEQRSPRWPVLFVMGSAKPSARHPLCVYSMPLFDDDMLARLAKASGEPVEKVRTMTQVLSQFDFRCLQAAMRRHCCAHDTSDGARACARGGGRSGLGLEQSGGPGPVTEAWVKRAGDKQGSGEGVVLRKWRGQEDSSEPVVLSEAAATRALTGGFLRGVFGDSAVRDIVVASRPLVVFDSTAPGAGVSLASPIGGEIECNAQGKGHDKLAETGSKKSPPRHEEEEVRNGASLVVEGSNSIAVALKDASSSPLRQLPPPQPPPGSRDPTTDGTAGALSHRQVSYGGDSSRIRADDGTGQVLSSKEDGVALVEQLVRTASARFRVHSVAARHRDGDSPSASSSLLSCRNLDLCRGLFIGGAGGARGGTDAGLRRRPASADSDELGLPPLKLLKRRRKHRESSRAPWAGGGEGAGAAEGSAEEEEEEQVETLGFLTARSTPRCLRPGFKVSFLVGST